MIVSNKKIIIISGIVLVAALLVVIWFWRPAALPPVDGQPAAEPRKTSLPGAPAFLDSRELGQVGIATDSPVQIFSDENGDNIIYKIIGNESEIVDDPGAVGSISSQQKLPTSE